jgi:hypothetical protein
MAAGLFAIAPGPALTAAALVVFLATGVAINVIVITLVTILLPNEVRGLSVSVLWAVGALFGLGLAPLTVSLLSELLGGPSRVGAALSMVCVATGLVAAVTFAVGRRRLAAFAPSADARPLRHASD